MKGFVYNRSVAKTDTAVGRITSIMYFFFNLYIVRLNTQVNSFSRVGVHIWNQIPATTKNLSKKSFQKEIKSNLLNDLNINHYDIDITKIFK